MNEKIKNKKQRKLGSQVGKNFKNKILFVTEELFPRDKGGIGKLLFDVAEILSSSFDIHFLILRGNYDFPNDNFYTHFLDQTNNKIKGSFFYNNRNYDIVNKIIILEIILF